MNASRTHRRRNAYARPYPNAADLSYFLNKLVNAAMWSASCVGLVTILFFMLTMF